jgi:hypothetical protein
MIQNQYREKSYERWQSMSRGREIRLARSAHLNSAFADAPTIGYIVEFGVGEGISIRQLVDLAADNQLVFGFDSFEGLPEEWDMGDNVSFPAGSFKYDPPIVAGVEYRIGWFKDTIPVWKQEHHGRIAFLHIDSYLYSSCVTILTELNDQIVPGTVIVFDEMYETWRHKNWKNGEYKAFNEWKTAYNRKAYPLATGGYGEASFRIVQ